MTTCAVRTNTGAGRSRLSLAARGSSRICCSVFCSTVFLLDGNGLDRVSVGAQFLHGLPDGRTCLGFRNAIDQRGFDAETLTGVVEPRFLARSQGAAVVCASISRTESARAVGSVARAVSQKSRPRPRILRQILGRSAQARHDRRHTVGEGGASLHFRGPVHRHEQSPMIHESDVVVILFLSR